MALDSLTPDKYQQIIFNMSAERTAIVKGIAGSGKSLMLLKKAKQVSTITDSYAIIVYTKSLKQFFVDELAEIGKTEGHVYYFEEWKRSSKPQYTYMFIDECQDFSANDIDDFMQHGKYCWFFGDSFQSIMGFKEHSVQSVEDTANQLDIHPQHLGINYRLSIENAKVGEYIVPESRLSFYCIKHGPKPRLIKSVSQLDSIIEYINNGMTDIGILVYYNNQVIEIKDYFQSKGIPVQWKTADGMEIDFKSTSPKIITWHCAKGLQFSNVYIPYCGLGEYIPFVPAHWTTEPMNCKSALYVATTRPLENLFLIYSNNLSPLLPDIDSTIYSGTDIADGPF